MHASAGSWFKVHRQAEQHEPETERRREEEELFSEDACKQGAFLPYCFGGRLAAAYINGPLVSHQEEEEEDMETQTQDPE